MEIPKTELFAVLQEFNPWWSGQPISDLPAWQRSVGAQVWRWVEDTQSRRMLLLSGARRTCGCRLLQDHRLPMEQVSQWLGHASLAQTQRAYAFLKVDNLHRSVTTRLPPPPPTVPRSARITACSTCARG